MAINTVINTNMMALTAHRNLAAVGIRQSKASQRLSSGKKINSAADDAAGLAISEKMKAQIKGLDMAAKNSEDAISLVQTAEGSLTEVNDMLTRVRELTVQAANDTNQQEDRVKIAEEVGTLLTEIDSISGRTEFNEKKLNDGSFQDGFFQIGANKGQKLELGIGNMSVFGIGAKDIMNAFGIEKKVDLNTESSASGVVSSGISNKVTTSTTVQPPAVVTKGGSLTLVVTNNNTGKDETLTFDFSTEILDGDKNDAAKSTSSIIAGLEANEDFNSKYKISDSSNKLVIENKEIGGDYSIKSIQVDLYKAEDGSVVSGKGLVKDDNSTKVEGYYNKLDLSKLKEGDTITIAGKEFKKVAKQDVENTINGFSDTLELSKLLEKDGITIVKDKNGKPDTAPAAGDTTIYITKVDSQNSGLAGTYTVDPKKVSNKGMDYSKTIETVDKALKTVTTQRAKLGANQNRLEHTINNLKLSSENLSAAKSRIEDTDMAKEMMNLTAANVLQQAATSMLAQANQAPNKITQLLG